MKPSILCLLAGCCVLASCNRYYAPVATKDPTIQSIKNYIGENKHLILRQPSATYELRNIRLDENAGEIHCDLQKISGLRTLQGTGKKKYYYYQPARADSIVAKQVYLYASRDFVNDSASVAIPLSAIDKTEELQFDQRKTSRHNAFLALGITGAVAVTVGTVVAIFSELQNWGTWGD